MLRPSIIFRLKKNRKRNEIGFEEYNYFEPGVDAKKKEKIKLSEYSVAGNILKNSRKKAIDQTDLKNRVQIDDQKEKLAEYEPEDEENQI